MLHIWLSWQPHNNYLANFMIFFKVKKKDPRPHIYHSDDSLPIIWLIWLSWQLFLLFWHCETLKYYID